MIKAVQRQTSPVKVTPIAITMLVLLGAVYLGGRASLFWLGLLLAGIGAVILLRRPIYGLFGLIAAALLLPIAINTGTDVFLYPAALVVPVLLSLWLLLAILKGQVRWIDSRVNLPLLLFLLANLLSIGIGNVLWDANVPRPDYFILVQLAQWAVFAFSAGAFWLAGNWLPDITWLRCLTFFFLLIAGSLVILSQFVGVTVMGIARDGAFIRAPFWVLLFSISAGQLLFNRNLAKGWQLFLGVVVVAILSYAFGQADERASNWVGITAASGVLFWFRFPRLRWPVAALTLLLLLSGFLGSFVYEFAGGDARWFESGGARIALIERAIEVTRSNPITGLGPATYRYYARIQPLIYEHIVWFEPRVASHNNYVDIYSYSGLLGLGLFLWVMGEIFYLGWRLRFQYKTGFAAAYINSMLATWAGMVVVMMLADWFLPNVYNIQFLGFQASVLVWLFLGGLLVLDQTNNGLNTSSEGLS